MRLLFAIEAGTDLGLGHLSRSGRVIGTLRAAGATVDIFLRGDAAALAAARARSLSPAVHVGVDIPSEGLRQRLQAQLSTADYDWLVVDGYDLVGMGIPSRLTLPERLCSLVIDDDAGRPFSATAVLNANVIGVGHYRDGGSRVRDRLLGPAYALLDPGCREYEWQNRTAGPLGRLLLSFGGADRRNWSRRVMDALAPWPRPLAIDLVLGPLNPHQFAHGAIAGGHRLVVHRAVPSLAPFLAAADAAVISASVTAWEACAVGTPSVVLKTVANQAEVVATLAETGVALAADAETVLSGDGSALRARLAELDDRRRRVDVSARARALVDGRGAERTAAYLLDRSAG